MADAIPLPEPWTYCYTFQTDTTQHLSFSANKYNGVPPTESVSIYTADQMHAHAAAVTAAARDCRTCAHFDCISLGCNADRCDGVNMYEPLPPVRLWRTTP